MARERFELVKTGENGAYPQEFVLIFQTALLLSLLDKGLLTQRQFEACEKEIQKRTARERQVHG